MKLTRRCAATALALCFLGAAWAQPTPSTLPADCPPAAAPPTAEEVRAGRAAARDRGFLWRIERDGRHSWLYGTVHVARRDWIFPGPRLGAALRDARVLALEIDPFDPAVQQQLSEPGRDDASEQRLPAGLQQRLARRIEAECLPPGALDRLPTLLQAGALTALAGRRDGLDPAYGIDAMLAGFGHAAGKRVVSLETPAQQLAALRGKGPADALRFIEQTLDELESGRIRPQLQRITDVWARGDLVTLADYPRWCDCIHGDADRALMRRLLDERNVAMAERIDALHREAGPLLAAVGSLHFIGPQGLPALLAARGFRVERIVYDTAAAPSPPVSKTP